jgi:peptidoglycan/LPS O-acetylase OafA/YrhL
MQPSGRSTASAGVRLHSLDGLRGVAAVIVLLHHVAMFFPAFAGTYLLGTTRPEPGSTLWWLSYSPLKLFTAGGEFVIVFFVLSGLVLSLPVLRRQTYDWAAYFPQRIVRLYLPVLGSIVVAAIAVLAVPQTPAGPPGTWIEHYSTPAPTVIQFISAANLFAHDSTTFHVNNPLWSLSWELAFSLMLPVFVLLALALRYRVITGVALVVAATAVGRLFGFEPLDFLPAFLIGSLVAVRFEDVRDLSSRINTSRVRHIVWIAVLIGGITLLILPWLTGPLPAQFRTITQVLNAATPVGAGIIVVVSLGWMPLVLTLSSRVVGMVGRISFSLYLTHVPVILLVYYAMHGTSLILVAPVAVAAALVVGAVFYWLVESRSHRLARFVGQWASAVFAGYRSNRDSAPSA